MNRPNRGPQFYILLPFLLIVFAVPYLFDVAYCEDLYGTPLSQAALVDGEKVDPSEAKISWTFFECGRTADVRVPPIPKSFTPQSSWDDGHIGAPAPVLLTSRPPPVS
jgi:hypothetical protein